MSIPRPEHPLPQLERANWMNLNGTWEFEIDYGKSGRNRRIYENVETSMPALSKSITVPFCPESDLSGIGHKDFMNCVWYRKVITIPDNWLEGNVFLHFGAVDYKSYIYVNGKEVGEHIGGYTSFKFNISAYLTKGENVITLCADDDIRSGRQTEGKQCGNFYSMGCHYTRTTGIWQTVWLEYMPKSYIDQVKYYPDPDNSCVTIAAVVCGSGVLTATASYGGKEMGKVSGTAVGGLLNLRLDLSERHLWEVGNGRLYDLTLELVPSKALSGVSDKAEATDVIKSYFGLRSLRLEGMKFLINGKSVFQRLVLDQGFYPDGIYTAPTEEAMINDINISLAAGFNGARLHEKVFESRFLYHCDRMGYIVWGEHANWGLDISRDYALYPFMTEWQEAVERDFNHPSIVGWCPFNETWDCNGRRQIDEILSAIYDLTKRLDPTRPCIDTSGNFHVKTDIYDIHEYEQNPEKFKGYYEEFKTGGKFFDSHSGRQQYGGQPMFVSEYGGIKWDVSGETNGWGYGQGPATIEEFMDRYKGLTETLLDNPNMFGLCYTQLYDVEQEVNGIYTYDRKPKFEKALMDEIFAINSRKAAIED